MNVTKYRNSSLVTLVSHALKIEEHKFLFQVILTDKVRCGPLNVVIIEILYEYTHEVYMKNVNSIISI